MGLKQIGCKNAIHNIGHIGQVKQVHGNILKAYIVGVPEGENRGNEGEKNTWRDVERIVSKMDERYQPKEFQWGKTQFIGRKTKRKPHVGVS